MRSSKTWTAGALISSLDETAAGETEEDVLERAPPDEDALRLEAARVDRSARRLAIVGIDEHPVGQAFDPLRDPVEDPVEASVERIRDLRREAQLDDLARRVPGEEVARRPLGDDLGLVHDDEAIAELLGLVHVVGRQDERRASLLVPVEAVPDEV